MVPKFRECRRPRHPGRRPPLRVRAKGSAPAVVEQRGAQPASGRLAELFLKFRLDALLLEARKIIDENLALEVIHLVLDADCEEFLCDEGERSAVQAKRTHRHALGTLDRLVYSRHRQAALLTILDAFAVEDLRIDQNQELISRLGGIDDDHSFVHVDLRRRESHPRRCVHGFGHVPDQGANRFVDLQYGRSPLIEPRIGVDRKSTRLNSSHLVISYAVFCLKKKKKSRVAVSTTSRMSNWIQVSCTRTSIHHTPESSARQLVRPATLPLSGTCDMMCRPDDTW